MDLSITLAGWIVLASQAAPPAAPKELLHESSDPAFSLRLPAGYSRVAAQEPVVSFIRPKGRELWEKVYVDLIPLDSELDSKTPPPQAASLRKLLGTDLREAQAIKIAWGTLEIDGIEYRFAREGVDMAARCAWVPLSPKSIALCVSAPSTLAKELTPELLALLAALKGRTQWLTDHEAASLRFWRIPALAVPVLSGLFLLTWAVVFRGNPQRLHYVRVAWHASIPVVAALGYFLLQRSSAAREKLGLETPLYLWLLLILPLSIFHVVMIAHRVRMAVEMGD